MLQNNKIVKRIGWRRENDVKTSSRLRAHSESSQQDQGRGRLGVQPMRQTAYLETLLSVLRVIGGKSGTYPNRGMSALAGEIGELGVCFLGGLIAGWRGW
jgi:hypothetical protein